MADTPVEPGVEPPSGELANADVEADARRLTSISTVLGDRLVRDTASDSLSARST
ncbi:hypothetical protein [Micromonospora craniellae]|uniref:hypothetical protein n=1 Tax=Micromonospora craniellae TaxID=2294034 RepID=UPI001314918B|nr:hypothetical protein [Micromonospora craniellae]QOC92100.1 hypothetical protein ID554_30335 [Micromonospora craniellae]